MSFCASVCVCLFNLFRCLSPKLIRGCHPYKVLVSCVYTFFLASKKKDELNTLTIAPHHLQWHTYHPPQHTRLSSNHAQSQSAHWAVIRFSLVPSSRNTKKQVKRHKHKGKPNDARAPRAARQLFCEGECGFFCGCCCCWSSLSHYIMRSIVMVECRTSVGGLADLWYIHERDPGRQCERCFFCCCWILELLFTCKVRLPFYESDWMCGDSTKCVEAPAAGSEMECHLLVKLFALELERNDLNYLKPWSIEY